MLVVACSNHEERHIDDVEKKHDHLCCCRALNFFNWTSQSQTRTSFWRWQHIAHLLHMSRFKHSIVLLKELSGSHVIFIFDSTWRSTEEQLFAYFFELLKCVFVNTLFFLIFIFKFILWVAASLWDHRCPVDLFGHYFYTEVQASVTIDVCCINICAKLDKSLHVLKMHWYCCKVEGCCLLSILMYHADIMAACENEDWQNALVTLCCTVHHRLITKCSLVRISLEIQHEDLDHVAVACRSCQVDSLRAHMRITMLGHLTFCPFVVWKLMSHGFQDKACFLEADKL